MTRLEKIEMAIERGITCDPITGKVYGVKGKEIKSKDRGYISFSMNKNKKKYNLRAHQFIYYCVHKKVVDYIDHINGIKYDNRIENLRSVTNQQNCYNMTHKGCYFNKQNKKWTAQIRIDGKKTNLGSFNTEEEAKQCYIDAKKIYHII